MDCESVKSGSLTFIRQYERQRANSDQFVTMVMPWVTIFSLIVEQNFSINL